MRYAKITDNIVTEILATVQGFKIEDCFHPEILVGITPIDSTVQVGWTLNSDGSFTETAKTEEQLAADAAEKAKKEADEIAAKAAAEAELAASQTKTE